jgi:acyl carrier protein
MLNPIAAEVSTFIVKNFLFGQRHELAPEQSFLQSGVIDSTGLLELVSFLEERYGIAVEDRELLPENLDSLRSVSEYVARKLVGPPVAD